VVVEGVLLDVGGTLWPDRWTEHPDDRASRAERIRQLAPGLDLEPAAALVDQLEEACQATVDGERQTTVESVASIIDGVGLTDSLAVCRALSLPFARGHRLLPGAADLVRRLHRRGVRLVVISNTVFRDTSCYWQDFADAGLADCLDGIVTSIDAGWRKPHPAIFAAAMADLGVPAELAAMVGNSETSDIVPAAALGLSTVRVAIEESAPASSRADAVVTSLDDVPAALFGGT
jgi:FMN phosphatase YigB (HAD superfamily)